MCFRRNWNSARVVLINQKARTDILYFEHFTASGMDEIYLPMLKEDGTEHLDQPSGNIFRASLSLGYVFRI